MGRTKSGGTEFGDLIVKHVGKFVAVVDDLHLDERHARHDRRPHTVDRDRIPDHAKQAPMRRHLRSDAMKHKLGRAWYASVGIDTSREAVESQDLEGPDLRSGGVVNSHDSRRQWCRVRRGPLVSAVAEHDLGRLRVRVERRGGDLPIPRSGRVEVPPHDQTPSPNRAKFDAS